MPVTPFHLGPAIALKAVLRGHFSLGVFALVQGVIDVESVWNVLHNKWPAHTRLHTFAGALAVAAVCALAGRPLCTALNARLAAVARRRADVPPWLAREFAPVTWTGALVGALVGGVSHVLLDGLMHADMAPLAPFRDGNPLLVPDSFVSVHLACAAVGALGVVAWLLLARRYPSRSAWQTPHSTPSDER